MIEIICFNTNLRRIICGKKEVYSKLAKAKDGKTEAYARLLLSFFSKVSISR